MWINRQHYREYVEANGRARDVLQGQVAGLLAERDRDHRLIETLRAKIEALHADVLEVTRKGSAHVAYADAWRLQCNDLRRLNASLLTRMVPDLTVEVPLVSSESAIHGSGLDFEDMGDAAARAMGLADEHPVQTIVGEPRIPAPPSVTGV